MPLIFHHLDLRTQYRILTLRFNYEKYIDRLKRFAISLSPSALLKGTYDRTAIVAVEKRNGKVVGAVLLSPLVDSLSLDIIVVDEAYRGKGIGTTLVELAKEHAKWLGARSIITSTSSNSIQARFFRDRGFVVRYKLDEMECKF
jgi:GNAT superfamily N-acetyltransferase